MFAGINSLARKMEILPEIQKTLKNLDDLFGKYFPPLDTKKYEWVINPFASYNTTNLDSNEQESLIDLKNDFFT